MRIEGAPARASLRAPRDAAGLPLVFQRDEPAGTTALAWAHPRIEVMAHSQSTSATTEVESLSAIALSTVGDDPGPLSRAAVSTIDSYSDRRSAVSPGERN